MHTFNYDLVSYVFEGNEVVARYSNNTILSNIEGVLSGLGTGFEMFVMKAFVIF